MPPPIAQNALATRSPKHPQVAGPAVLVPPGGSIAQRLGVPGGARFDSRDVSRLDAGSSEIERFLRSLVAQMPPDAAWIGFLSYALGAVIESERVRCAPDPATPLGEFHLVRGPDASAWPAHDGTHGCVLNSLGDARGRYTRAVTSTLKRIADGDIYQANIAHQIRGEFSGDPDRFFSLLARGAHPAQGLAIRGPAPGGEAYALLSLSPELFLRYDALTRRLTTRPMKGTRPGHADPASLFDAAKDRAELAMIVDLMRNDLGRVCEFGSVRVETPRRVERHASGAASVLQATATVSGTVRQGLDIADIILATFPPGSVTGAPKIRAMQIIDELEPFARGPYCGCIGAVFPDGSFELGVAIRTAVITGPVLDEGGFDRATLTYNVGAGIVADSDPQAEWDESLAKARVLTEVVPPPV